VLTRGRLIGLGLFRAALGAAVLVRPADLPKALGVDSATAERITYLGRMIGARDIALGLGTVDAAHRRVDPSIWLLGSALCDLTDAVAFAAAGARGTANRVPALGLGALAGWGAAMEWLLHREAAAARD
jgi:hypothetical protein